VEIVLESPYSTVDKAVEVRYDRWKIFFGIMVEGGTVNVRILGLPTFAII
jgi:hypothetical protein